MLNPDVLIIGAGAAGLHCAAQAARRGKSVLVVDHAKQAGKKILISGGGRCNFTNLYTSPDNYLSSNPHFCKSALSRYTQWDFMALVDHYQIPYHEKTLGQLFCDDSAKDIVKMLLAECERYGAKIQLRTDVLNVSYEDQYHVTTSQGTYRADKLVIACGGLSMPKLGATPLGYRLAEQFGHTIVPVRAGLVPLTLHEQQKQHFADLAGVSLPITASAGEGYFREAMLFTHRGLSGPAILQISSYWPPGETVSLNLLPDQDALQWLEQTRTEQPKAQLGTLLQSHFPKRVVQALAQEHQWPVTQRVAEMAKKQLEQVAEDLNHWSLKPAGTEGYRTAEVTLGGVNVDQVSSKSMASKLQPGLYFIGEVLDVTGWLGGYNFQWAWASAYAAAQDL
ncbi:NAD(P)/FAD-dependent oxidoreductase [Idiomarina seosinensis]|uniref:NAD(P)/FAD-dependent oxidoreductase n=1 Tax=Idiomarina seosinensis TaxID=281739 RepID=UPI00384EF18F